MKKLTREDLLSLETYSTEREDFRARVLAHKANRRVAIGPNAMLYFEDALTMQYQVQEMLRIERIFETPQIQEELDAYNPLIPDGSNLKATFTLEYSDVDERRQALARLIGIERALWLQANGEDRIRPVANEDLERETADKTSAVHFVRFELTPAVVQSIKGGNDLSFGIDHPQYTHDVTIGPKIRSSLLGDLK
jgi:hypothetical protein